MSYHVKLKILRQNSFARRWDMPTNYRLSGAQELTVAPWIQRQFLAERGNLGPIFRVSMSAKITVLLRGLTCKSFGRTRFKSMNYPPSQICFQGLLRSRLVNPTFLKPISVGWSVVWASQMGFRLFCSLFLFSQRAFDVFVFVYFLSWRNRCQTERLDCEFYS